MSSSHPSRHHRPHAHLRNAYGSDDVFGRVAERFARFFGTPRFLIGQTVLMLVWIGANAAGYAHFDIYPFILLNLAFSVQSAYAAPLILLAQTRQADRDKANSEADAQHREEIAQLHAEILNQILDQNRKIAALTEEVHARVTT